MKSYKFVLFFILILAGYLGIVYATPQREAGSSDALPIVAYGKDSSGILRALLTDSSGVLQTS